MRKVISPMEKCPSNAEWRIFPLNKNYVVSEYGHMRHISKDQLLVPYFCKKQSTSYFTYSPSQNGIRRTYGCHVIVARTFIGPPPSARHQVAHGDGSTTNNHYRNLRYALPKENKADSYRHGTICFGLRNGSYTKPHNRPKGEKNGFSKLTCDKVKEIRKSNLSHRKLAVKFGVSKTTIGQAIRGETWQHLRNN